MWRSIAAVLLAVAAAGHDELHELSFAETVQLVARASREGFRPLKTFRIEMHPRRDYWYNVTNVLPGASMCRIFEHPQLVYRCEWNQGKITLQDLAAQIGTALGDRWKRVNPSATVVRFEPHNPHRDGLVELRRLKAGADATFHRVNSIE